MLFEDGTGMRKSKVSQLRSRGLGTAFLLVILVFVAGCGQQQAGIAAPTLTTVSPNSGTQGQTVAVTLTGTNFAAGCTIGLSGMGITISNPTVVSSTQITATFTIGATAAAGAQNVTVTCPGGTTSAQTFTVLGPTLTTVSPSSGTQGQSVAVTLTGTVFAAGCTIGLTGTGITVSNTMVVSSTQITATFAIGAAAAPGARNVTVTCPGGTTNAQTFTVNLLAPTITSTSPANGATAVPINRTITATFSKAMNPATITTGTFTVTGATPVTGVVTYDAASNTATFTPSAPLAANTTFTATVTAGAQDTAGNALVGGGAPNPWTFTTGSSTDATAPTVIATSPANAATAVPINTKITATFSEAMNPATITTTAFTVTGPGATPVAGTVTYAAVSNTATFTPSVNLAANTAFTATVTTGATDLAGNALAGGGAPNPWTFTTGATADATAPTIILTNPANAAMGVAINASVNATFSEAMDPSTINSGTFTLTGPGVTPVTGTVTYNPASRVATFTPASSLAINSTFTATVTTGARDLAGNALVSGAVPNPWTFTTGSTTAGQGPVNLLSAGNFAILAGSTVTNVGPTIINGDLGVSPGTATTGFPPGVVNGVQHLDPDPIVQQAKLDLTTAFNDAAGRTLNVITIATGELGALTLAPGLYRSGIGSFAITSVDLTLDAQGDANAVWIFQMPSSTLTVGNGRQVILAGGAQASNIFWSVGTSATIGTTAVFKGTILADQSITLQTGAVLDGRALTRIAAVTLDSNIVTKPAP